jgi:hypothetical protein
VAPILIRFARFPVFHTFTSGGGNDLAMKIENCKMQIENSD